MTLPELASAVVQAFPFWGRGLRGSFGLGEGILGPSQRSAALHKPREGQRGRSDSESET